MRSSKGSDRPSTGVLAESMTKPANPQRRGFLLTLGVGGAGAVVVAANKLTGVAEVATAEPALPVESKGYALNDHIRRYYQTTKV
jgi:hypothetical protein